MLLSSYGAALVASIGSFDGQMVLTPYRVDIWVAFVGYTHTHTNTHKHTHTHSTRAVLQVLCCCALKCV
jgi:hypothetical protein